MSGLFQLLGRSLASKTLAGAPSVWGKLPGQGDFFHHRADMSHRQDWQQWVEAVWSLCPAPAPVDKLRRRAGAVDWMQLEAVKPVRRLHQVPIAFVLPPGTLPFSPSQFVQGVMVPSHDKVGRACPLIVYQRVSPVWMQRLWQPEIPTDGLTQLFWWARLAWQAVQPDVQLAPWLQRLDAMWALQAPALAQWLGGPASVVSVPSMQAIVGPDRLGDPAYDLRGVYHLPWADWPERCLRRHQPVAAFWTQDGQGGYVQAAPDLAELWGRP